MDRGPVSINQPKTFHLAKFINLTILQFHKRTKAEQRNVFFVKNLHGNQDSVWIFIMSNPEPFEIFRGRVLHYLFYVLVFRFQFCYLICHLMRLASLHCK